MVAAVKCFQLAADHSDSKTSPQVASIANTNLATALQHLGRDREAKAALARAVAADGGDVEALVMYGKALQKDGEVAEAGKWIDKAVALDPQNAKAVYAQGTIAQQDGRYEDALVIYERAATLDKTYLAPQIQEAIVLSLLKQCTRALSKAQLLNENFPEMDAQMQSALAAVFSGCDEKQMVLDSYLSSILKAPGAIVQVGSDVRTNEYRAANVLLELERPRLAIDYLLKAAAVPDPDAAGVQSMLGYAYTELGGRYFGEAIMRLSKALALAGLQPPSVHDDAAAAAAAGRDAAASVNVSEKQMVMAALANLVRLKYVCADWRDLEWHISALQAVITSAVDGGNQSPSNPVFVLAYPIPDTLVTRVAVSYGAHNQELYGTGSAWDWRDTFSLAKWQAQGQAEPVRVGFLSADLNSNGVGRHLEKWRLWTLCNKSPQLVCYIIASGETDDIEVAPLKQVALAAGHNKVVRVGKLSDARAVRVIRNLKLQLLLDLNGYTMGERPALVNAAGGLAPLQAQFYGYEGSYGSAAFSHILTDWGSASVDFAGAVPGAGDGDAGKVQEGMFAEKLLLLPPSKFPNGDLMSRNEVDASDKERGLRWRARNEFAQLVLSIGLAPAQYDSTFVFCNFAKAFKIQPPIFEAWVRVLRRVPRSVLWLFGYRKDAAHLAIANLRKRAVELGLDPARLIFTNLLERDQHLDLKSYAHLYLDTTPYNGHLTVAEALWSGVPVLTLPQARMASRVTYSNLRALGLAASLVARTIGDYENLAVAIAKQWLRETDHRGGPDGPDGQASLPHTAASNFRSAEHARRGGAGSGVEAGSGARSGSWRAEGAEGGVAISTSWYASLREALGHARAKQLGFFDTRVRTRASARHDRERQRKRRRETGWKGARASE
jgi:protein O-GlcNAc transferase